MTVGAGSLLGDLEHSTFGSEREELFAEFMRLLASSQDGGSTVAECLSAVSCWERDDESWYREWIKLAQTSRERGDAALTHGHVVTAQRNWLRATNYFMAAIVPLDPGDERRQASIAAMRSCARSLLTHRQPAGEVVSIPWLSDHPLQGYFLPARRSAPTVICIGEPGHRKEEFLFKLGRHGEERGLAMLALDLMGEQGDGRLEQIVGRANLESSITHVLDYLCSRTDVDSDRIAIVADGCSSSFVARAVAREPRLAAAVCDGGLWDLQERAFMARRTVLRDSNSIYEHDPGGIVRSIGCPVLVTLGERGWLKTDRARQLVQQLRACRLDVTLKVFTGSETASAQGHADNPGLANEYIFDWLASRLKTPARQHA